MGPERRHRPDLGLCGKAGEEIGHGTAGRDRFGLVAPGRLVWAARRHPTRHVESACADCVRVFLLEGDARNVFELYGVADDQCSAGPEQQRRHGRDGRLAVTANRVWDELLFSRACEGSGRALGKHEAQDSVTGAVHHESDAGTVA